MLITFQVLNVSTVILLSTFMVQKTRRVYKVCFPKFICFFGVTMVATLHVINSMVVIAAKRHVGTGATTNAELAVTIAKTRNFPFGS